MSDKKQIVISTGSSLPRKWSEVSPTKGRKIMLNAIEEMLRQQDRRVARMSRAVDRRMAALDETMRQRDEAAAKRAKERR